MKKRSLKLGAVAIALAVAGTIALPAAAQAAGPTGCTTLGYTCMWMDGDYKTASSSGNSVKWQQYIPNFGTWNYGSSTYNAANSASSLYNNGNTETVYLYDNTSKSGFAFSRGVQQFSTNFAGAFGVGHNDNLESGYFASFN
jgi:hypothetical protein